MDCFLSMIYIGSGFRKKLNCKCKCMIGYTGYFLLLNKLRCFHICLFHKTLELLFRKSPLDSQSDSRKKTKGLYLVLYNFHCSYKNLSPCKNFFHTCHHRKEIRKHSCTFL